MSAKRITIKDVAQLAKVSVMTVSRAISQPHTLSPKTLNRVQEAIDELDYHVNLSARSLTGSKSKTIGICVSSFQKLFFSTYFFEMANGIEEIVRNKGYSLLIHDIYGGDQSNKYSLLKDRRIDGMIVYSPRENDISLDLLKQQGYNFISVSGYPATKKIDFVDGDNHSGIHLAVEHLVKLGHTRIAFIKGLDYLSDAIDRFEAFKDSLQLFNVPLVEEYIITGDFLSDVAFNATKPLFKLPNPPTAIVAANDFMAIGAIEAMNSMGIKVPDDVAVIGFDDIEVAQHMSPTLTTIRQPVLEMGKRAAELLFDKINGKYENEIIQEYLPMKLIVRESCGSQLKKEIK